MGYSTYFKGSLGIEIEGQVLEELKELIHKEFKNKYNAISLTKSCLAVDGEWKDNGLMEEMVLLVQSGGRLNNGKIICEGEDMRDVWEIIIKDNQAYLNEIGDRYTLSRTYTKLQTI